MFDFLYRYLKYIMIKILIDIHSLWVINSTHTGADPHLPLRGTWNLGEVSYDC